MVVSSQPTSAGAARTGRLDLLRAAVSCPVLQPSDDAYADARIVLYNRHAHPMAIVQATSEADVVATVRFAREHALPLAVRSGGHSVAGHGAVDDAIVLDLAAMNAVEIDAESRIARVQAGATSADLAGPAAELGLALSTGDTHSVGIGGLAPGGGIGFLVRKHGLTIDSMLAATVVTAEGELITASAESHSDLFWAIRGGGGNFGIVTGFTFQLAEVPQVHGGMIVLPATPEVIRGYLTLAPDAPDELTTIANIMHLPPLPFAPQDRIGEPVLLVMVVWCGDEQGADAALAPLRGLAEPIVDMVAPMPYPALFQMTAHQAEPHAVAMRCMFADDLSDDAIEAILAAIADSSSPMSLVQLRGLGGAYARVANDATAFAHRDRRLFVSVINIWMDLDADRAPHEVWTGELWRRLESEGSGAYANFLGDEGAARVRAAYPGETFTRLQAIKRQYDPHNIFRFNQNIDPNA